MVVKSLAELFRRSLGYPPTLFSRPQKRKNRYQWRQTEALESRVMLTNSAPVFD